MATTTTELTQLKLNYLTKAQYDEAKIAGNINQNELYLTEPEDYDKSEDVIKSLMAAREIDGVTTTFPTDGSIVNTYIDGNIKVTVFNTDGTITDTYKNSSGVVLKTKITTFNVDGSITTVIA